MDYMVHGILQARILEWVAIPYFRGFSHTRDRTQVSCIAGRFFTSWATHNHYSFLLQGTGLRLEPSTIVNKLSQSGWGCNGEIVQQIKAVNFLLIFLLRWLFRPKANKSQNTFRFILYILTQWWALNIYWFKRKGWYTMGKLVKPFQIFHWGTCCSLAIIGINKPSWV